MEFSKRLDLFGDEIFAALNERKVALEAQGRTIYNLSVGTPGFAPDKDTNFSRKPRIVSPSFRERRERRPRLFVGREGNRVSSGTPYRDAASDEGVTPCESRAQSPRARSTCSTMSRTAPSPPRNSET